MSQLDQLPSDFGEFDIFAHPELWTDFLHMVLETTAKAYQNLKQENMAQKAWEENTFTINIERCMKQIIRQKLLSLSVSTQQNIYTSAMMQGKVSANKAVKLDIKAWNPSWYSEDRVYFTWECKLIVDKARETKHHRLINEYITEGLVRFLDEHWKYAEQVDDAGMLGYVLDGAVPDVVTAINQEIVAIPRRPTSKAKDERKQQALLTARRLSPTDLLRPCNPNPIEHFTLYESSHQRLFCDKAIHLYHFLLTFDFDSI